MAKRFRWSGSDRKKIKTEKNFQLLYLKQIDETALFRARRKSSRSLTNRHLFTDNDELDKHLLKKAELAGFVKLERSSFQFGGMRASLYKRFSIGRGSSTSFYLLPTFEKKITTGMT